MSAQETCISANVCSWPRGFHSTVCRRRSRRGCIRGNHARSCLSRRFAHTKLWQRHGGNTDLNPRGSAKHRQCRAGSTMTPHTHTLPLPPLLMPCAPPAADRYRCMRLGRRQG